jgi:hypothetical protein
VFSLAIVTPVVAGYLIYDWNRMLAAVDKYRLQEYPMPVANTPDF